MPKCSYFSPLLILFPDSCHSTFRMPRSLNLCYSASHTLRLWPRHISFTTHAILTEFTHAKMQLLFSVSHALSDFGPLHISFTTQAMFTTLTHANMQVFFSASLTLSDSCHSTFRMPCSLNSRMLKGSCFSPLLVLSDSCHSTFRMPCSPN